MLAFSIIYFFHYCKGYTLQGYVPPSLAAKWTTPIEEGVVYQIKSAKIADYNKHTQLVEAPVQIQPTESTLFEMLPADYEHPHIKCNFSKLSFLPEFVTNQTLYKGFSLLLLIYNYY